MRPEPRLLDLFCGAGGASAGYAAAGFDVTGVDIRPQPRYPYQFVQADALAFLQAEGWRGFDVIHASPPCQRYSIATKVRGPAAVAGHPDLIAPLRAALAATGLPYIIENVPGAPLRAELQLCGSMFGLGVRRHRLWEGAVPLMAPAACNHAAPAVPVYGHSGGAVNRGRERRLGRSNGVADWRIAMAIDWMTGAELAEAIPPAYTEWLGRALLAAI